MNVEEKLRQAKSQFPQHTVDKKRFSESLWTKVKHLDRTQRTHRSRWKWMVPYAGVLFVGGVAFSPMIASAVQKVPLVQVVMNWVKGTDAAPYVRNVQQSSTDHGITMTITDVLYGPSQLSFGYIVSPGQSAFPHGGVVAFANVGSPNGMVIFVNGKQVQLQGGGNEQPTAYGYKGLVTLTDDGTATTLPNSFNFQIVLHKIGNQRGTWKFTVPVSRKNMTPDQSFLPMATKQIGNETVTIKEVQMYPTGGMIDYDVTVPVGVNPSLNMTLFTQNKSILDSVLSDPETSKSHVTHSGFEIWSYDQPFRVPGQKPTSLIISLSIPSKSESRLVPVTGPFPVTMTSGVFGKLVITGIEVKGNTVIVHYESPSDPITPGFGFSIEDTTHPNESFGGSLGEKDGLSGSDTYMNVYQFSSDVSSDKLMLRLPGRTKGNVFDVPLRNNLK